MELLKLLVLIKTGMFFERTFDAMELSEVIFFTTGKYVAATALLHLYGFMPTEYPPSIYVHDALAAFCGYESYKAYLREIEVEDV